MAQEGAQVIESVVATEAYITTGTVGALAVSTGMTLAGTYQRTSQTYRFSAMTGRAGATATVGYVNTGVDTDLVTLAQNATADTWVIPLTGLHEGDTLQSIGISGQIESGGNAVTVDYELHKTTAVATGCTSVKIQSGTQIAKSADYLMADSTTISVPPTVTAGESYFMLITCTTNAACDVELQYVTLTLTQS